MSVSPVLLAALLERWRGCRSVAVVRPLASNLAVALSGGLLGLFHSGSDLLSLVLRLLPAWPLALQPLREL